MHQRAEQRHARRRTNPEQRGGMHLPVDLITVSRQFGSGGSDFALALGERLGWPVFDHELVCRVADRLALDRATVERLDEHPPTRLSLLASALLVVPPEAAGCDDARHALSPDAVANAVREVLLDAAKSPPLIIVGHGAQCVFHDRPASFHVRLVAPMEKRLATVMKRCHVDRRTAASRIHRMDTDRDAYVQRYHHVKREDPLLYDLQVNTGSIGVGELVAMVSEIVSARDISQQSAHGVVSELHAAPATPHEQRR
jgi:CMP/dCMP kinase